MARDQGPVKGTQGYEYARESGIQFPGFFVGAREGRKGEKGKGRKGKELGKKLTGWRGYLNMGARRMEDIQMIQAEAKAEVFWLAFKGLPKKEQHLVVQKLLQDREFVEDLMDIALIEQRRCEPSRPLEEYLAN